MNQIYLEPEHRAELEAFYCSKCNKRPRAENRKSCERCLEVARRGHDKHRAERNAKLEAKRAAARATGYCTNCFAYKATVGLAWCNKCRKRNALSYRNASPEQQAKRLERGKAYYKANRKRISAARRTPEWREKDRARAAAKKLQAVAREEALSTGEPLSQVLKRMGADPAMVARWERREERGNAR